MSREFWKMYIFHILIDRLHCISSTGRFCTMIHFMMTTFRCVMLYVIIYWLPSLLGTKFWICGRGSSVWASKLFAKNHIKLNFCSTTHFQQQQQKSGEKFQFSTLWHFCIVIWRFHLRWWQVSFVALALVWHPHSQYIQYPMEHNPFSWRVFFW